MASSDSANGRVVRCPLCEGRQFATGRLGLLTCAECSVVLSPSIWEPQANEALVDEWFGKGYEPDASFWVRGFEAWNNRRTLARISRLALPGRRLLEIGVGSGSLLRAAQQVGFGVMGCDLSNAIASRVNRTLGIAIHCGLLSEIPGDRRLDVIIMNHVLEHVSEPVAFLRDAFRLLAPGGVVHIAVPNVASWEAKLSGWTSYEPYHLVYFTPDTLRQTVLASGFSIEDELTHEPFSGWFLAIARSLFGTNQGGRVIDPTNRLKSRVKSPGRQSVTEHAYRMAMLIAGGGTWPLRWCQARLHRGEEAICLARKPADV